jgi:predicted  nucleic acid-binding Zn-ribbon protein
MPTKTSKRIKKKFNKTAKGKRIGLAKAGTSRRGWGKKRGGGDTLKNIPANEEKEEPTSSSATNINNMNSEDDTLANEEKEKSSTNIMNFEDQLKNTTNELITSITEKAKGNYGSRFYDEMKFIIDDFNDQLKKILPRLDDQTVQKLMTFLSMFNQKFENDETFKKDFENAAEHFMKTVVEASNKTLQTGSTMLMSILSNMIQGIPGIGAIASIMKVANNITETAAVLTTSVNEASESLRSLMMKITNISNEMQTLDKIPKTNNENNS